MKRSYFSTFSPSLVNSPPHPSVTIYSSLPPLLSPPLLLLSSVMDLIYWKDTERTGMVFTGLVVGLLSLFQLSIITIISTISLGALCFTVSVSLYYKILHVLNMGDGVPPFK